MKIAVGSDHAGYEAPEPFFKPEIMRHLVELGHEVIDCGTSGPESVDYPDFAQVVCEKILAGEADMGVLVCGTGIGISIAANRYAGIRAAACTTPEVTRLVRTHNDANIIAFGRRTTPLKNAIEMLDIFLTTPFSGEERHVRRVGKLDKGGCGH